MVKEYAKNKAHKNYTSDNHLGTLIMEQMNNPKKIN